MKTTIVSALSEINAQEWNALLTEGYPFLRYEFLAALEQSGCVGADRGWYPQHIVCRDDDGVLMGAAPLYLKDNSSGEFVFDWAWADAYHRHGVDYYPKMVGAIPYTPASGPRFLLAETSDKNAIRDALISRAQETAKQIDCSSIHWLYADEEDHAALVEQGFLTRLSCNFDWHNADYPDFDQFLAALNAKKRKNIRRERRLVADAGIQFRVLSGSELSAEEWHLFYKFYANTYHERGRSPYLKESFFHAIAATMGDCIVLMLAQKDGHDVAGAISLCSDDTLYGRHWGCRADYDSLHFEACYYQGIDYCIRHGLKRFDPGIQGEHKIWRGFLPTISRSAHWLAHPSFSDAIGDFLRRESPAVEAYARQLKQHSPYRCDETQKT